MIASGRFAPMSCQRRRRGKKTTETNDFKDPGVPGDVFWRFFLRPQVGAHFFFYSTYRNPWKRIAGWRIVSWKRLFWKNSSIFFQKIVFLKIWGFLGPFFGFPVKFCVDSAIFQLERCLGGQKPKFCQDTIRHPVRSRCAAKFSVLKIQKCSKKRNCQGLLIFWG